jgi:hypothetical protein
MPKAITSFPHSTEPSLDPVLTTKDSPGFSKASAEPLFPPQNLNLPLDKTSVGSSPPLLALQYRTLSLPQQSAPGQGASEKPTLLGPALLSAGPRGRT